ncbi:hypothetical protein D8674_028793 [Pyrus ussuriensis x Pyrus communis]|uniref:Uncharacterized protein n=1 Tax=Pyrus ussuriensis x Pyrus communis TaxID=2448454 RepID=A0A5N5HXB6_9ROSA|nr:hypothetical protein D8674_028793 [Pyrus ussuriensis x Pyrus communis]
MSLTTLADEIYTREDGFIIQELEKTQTQVKEEMKERVDANAEEEDKSAEVKPFANFQDGVGNEGMSPNVA